MLYDRQALPVREEVISGHTAGISGFSGPGTWYSGEERIAVLAETRAARHCGLCTARKTALSPYTLQGEHDSVTGLPEPVLEVVHRITTDSGRLTEKWFHSIMGAGLSEPEYIEIVSLVATATVLDSFAVALGCEVADPGEPLDGEPSRIRNDQVCDGGAWVPLYDLPQEMTDTGLPTAPNIFRAMGLVPSGIDHFFGVMRSHYALADQEADISRSQIELIASRVSALNECFY